LLTDFRQLLQRAGEEANARLTELQNLASQCDQLARMDFTLLYDSARELFSLDTTSAITGSMAVAMICWPRKRAWPASWRSR
jgi:hypothetical protein